MEELLSKLGIAATGGKTINNSYVIDFDTEDDWSRAYSKLDKSDLVDEDQETALVDMHGIHAQYVNDDFIIDLIADYDADTYKLIIKEN